jgi:hypothetical protein
MSCTCQHCSCPDSDGLPAECRHLVGHIISMCQDLACPVSTGRAERRFSTRVQPVAGAPNLGAPGGKMCLARGAAAATGVPGGSMYMSRSAGTPYLTPGTLRRCRPAPRRRRPVPRWSRPVGAPGEIASCGPNMLEYTCPGKVYSGIYLNIEYTGTLKYILVYPMIY